MEIRLATADEVKSVMAAGEIQPSARLALNMSCCITPEEMHKNFYATLERGFTPINGLLGQYSGTCSIVGSGPTIHETYKELTGDVIAINSAIGFLLGKGIVPKFALMWDGADIIEQFAVPHPDITYLVASRCHPKVFERLKDCKVIVWHAGGDHDIAQIMVKPEVFAKMKINQPLINGGSAGITRTLYVASVLGYSDIHIFGADSSYSASGATHVNGSLVPEKDMLVMLGNEESGSVIFRTTPEWCAQVNEYRMMYCLTVTGHLSALTNMEGIFRPVTLEVHGDSLLKAMHDRLVEKRKLVGDEAFVKSISEQDEEQRKMDSAASGISEEDQAEGAHIEIKPEMRDATFAAA